MAFIMSASNQKFALEGKILKPHLQGLRAEANTLVKWSFIPVWEAYSISLEQLSWAKVFENVNKDRRKYCRSVYYGESLFKYTALLFLKCQGRSTPQPAPCGLQVRARRCRRRAPGTSRQKPQWSVRSGLVTSRAHTGPCPLIVQDLRTTSQAPRLPWGHPGMTSTQSGERRTAHWWSWRGVMRAMPRGARGPAGGQRGRQLSRGRQERLSAPNRHLAHQDPHPLPAPRPLPHSFWHDT